MKIEQLLVQHFYNKKEITLQGLGTFRLSPDFILPAENEKDIVMPENAVNFEYNPKAGEDDALIDHIVLHTRKIKPLASADLDSYLVLGKQFLNIGKPFRIEGLGVLEKNMNGEYEFKQGQYTHAKADVMPVVVKDKLEKDISFATEKPSNGNGRRKALLIAAILLLLGLIGWGGWYYWNKHYRVPESETTETTTPAITDTIQTNKDTVRQVTANADTTHSSPASTSNPEGYTFRVVFRETADLALAESKMKELIARKHKVILVTTSDSLLFKLAEPFKLPLSDTARVRDSLNMYYYNGKAYVEVYK